MTGVAVVGLNRGGTSAVAGVLHHLGFFMGDDLWPPSIHNPKGYFEDKRITELHTAMMGGDWKNPDLDHLFWNRDPLGYIRLIREFEKHPRWAMKDPRFCFLLPELKTHCRSIKVIAVFRDPYQCANSLFRRGGHTLEEARAISLRYLKAMMQNVPDDAHWVYYNDLVECPELAVREIAEYLGVEVTQEAVDFVDKSLRHWR